MTPAQIAREYDEAIDASLEVYDAAIARAQAALGPPVHAGQLRPSDAPDAFGLPPYNRPDEWAWRRAYWELGEDRVQVEILHEDRGLPLIVAFACYPGPSTMEA